MTHMVKDYRKCCLEPGCPHPICSSGPPSEDLCWYADRLLLSQFPLPRKNPARVRTAKVAQVFVLGSTVHYWLILQIPKALPTPPPPVCLTKRDGAEITVEFVGGAAEFKC